MNFLFSQLDRLESQVIIKRLTDRRLTLSPDDIVLEGMFPSDLINALSRSFPPPLSFKVEVDNSEYLKAYTGFEWNQTTLLYCGVSLLPYETMQQMINFENAWQYIRLITTTEAGSILRSWLAVKPKGLISVTKNSLEFILPMHRIDLLLLWLDRLQTEVIDLNWISGSTGEIAGELLQHLGSLNQARLPVLETWISRTSASEDLDFQRLFARAMVAIPF